MGSSIFGTPLMPQSTPGLEDRVQQAAKMMKSMAPGQSPQQMLQSLQNQNPQISNLLGLLNSNNGDIRVLVTNLAKQQGVDLNALYEIYKTI